MTFVVTIYQPAHFDGVDALWRTVFPGDPPWNAAEVAVPAKLALNDGLLLVALDGGAVVGTIIAGWDGHRGWLYALAVHPDRRRAGIARALVDEALTRLRSLGCTKTNLQVRAGNDAAVAFWRSVDFEVEERVSMGRRL